MDKAKLERVFTDIAAILAVELAVSRDVVADAMERALKKIRAAERRRKH